MTTAWSRHGFTLAWHEEGKSSALLFLGKFQVGDIHRWPGGSWGARIPIGQHGKLVGYYDTEQAARDALVAATLEAMRDE